MIHIVIAEDESRQVELLKGYLDRLQAEWEEPFKVTVFENGMDLLDAYSPNFDIILLDIMMPHLDGMKTARRIRERDQDVVLIFITNMANYAIHGYEVNALDFIVKPVEYFPFSWKMKRALETVKARQDRYLFLPVNGEKRKIAAKDISYIEVYNHNLSAHTRQGIIEFYGTLSAMEKELRECYFVRCHAGYLVNLNHVDSYREDFCVVGGDEIPISRPKKKAFLKALAEYIGKGLAR